MVVFKDYNQNQLMLLPPSLEVLIEPNHPVRVVNEIKNRINADKLIKQYVGGGTSSYHPRMLMNLPAASGRGILMDFFIFYFAASGGELTHRD